MNNVTEKPKIEQELRDERVQLIEKIDRLIDLKTGSLLKENHRQEYVKLERELQALDHKIGKVSGLQKFQKKALSNSQHLTNEALSQMYKSWDDEAKRKREVGEKFEGRNDKSVH